MQAPSVEYFIISKGKRKIAIVGEQNCLFRALSQQMCKSEVHHSILHTTIVRFDVPALSNPCQKHYFAYQEDD